MRRRRILRAYTFGEDAKLLNHPKVSSAMLPLCRLMGMKLNASVLAGAPAATLQQACVDVLVWHRRRRLDRMHAVALIGCPPPSETASLHVCPVTLTTAISAHTGAFVAMGPDNALWAGQALRGRLDDILGYFTDCVRYVQRPDALVRPGMLTPVA